MKYDAFLSYNRNDAESVKYIADWLQHVKGLRVFFDLYTLIPGDSWPALLQEGLINSKAIVFIIGDSGISTWQDEEIQAAIRKDVEFPDQYRLIPVLLPGSRIEDVPLFLSSRSWINFEDNLYDIKKLEQLGRAIRGYPLTPVLFLEAEDSLDDNTADSLLKEFPYNDIIPNDAQLSTIIQNGMFQVSVDDLLDASTNQVEIVISSLESKYIPNLYVNRHAETSLYSFISARQDEDNFSQCYVIVAPAGSGKTNLICNIAERIKGYYPVFLLVGGQIFISESAGILKSIQIELEIISPKMTDLPP